MRPDENMNMQISCQAPFRTALLGSIALALLGELASGQPNDLSRRHMGATGTPCLSLRGHPKAQTINPNIIEHMVSIANSCGQLIKVQVCYQNTQQCIAVSVLPYQRTDAVLGIAPGLTGFRFDSKEQF
jgi:hypothetical protein